MYEQWNVILLYLFILKWSLFLRSLRTTVANNGRRAWKVSTMIKTYLKRTYTHIGKQNSYNMKILYICFFQELMKRRQWAFLFLPRTPHSRTSVYRRTKLLLSCSIYDLSGIGKSSKPTWCPPGTVWDVSKQENAVRRTKMSHDFIFLMYCIIFKKKKKKALNAHRKIY